jgi:hypothetical protein
MILYVLYLPKVITCIKWYPTSGPNNITLDKFYCIDIQSACVIWKNQSKRIVTNKINKILLPTYIAYSSLA